MKNAKNFLVVMLCMALFAFAPAKQKKIIVLDPGHGGEDVGCTMGKVSEKELVKQIAYKIKQLDKLDNTDIVLLRLEDEFMDLKTRIEVINSLNPDLVLSLHINSSSNADKNGVEIYVSKTNAYFQNSLTIANNLVEHLTQTPFAKGKVLTANYTMLKNSNCPAVILELGYITNSKDFTHLTSETSQKQIAENLYSFLTK